MRFLTVADRELRSAARHKATYRVRWITAAVFFGLLVWMLWAFQGFSNRRAPPQIFRVYSVLAFLYCLFIATARTADCISGERREGTLGLLFLTNLNSAEIVAGKLCSTALASVYGLMAIFPMLALPLLMGGVAFTQFWRTVLSLLNGILFALAAGFLSSVICRRQFVALALAMGLTVSIAGGLLLGSVVANSYGPTKPFAPWLADFSALHTVIAAGDAPTSRSDRFWLSAAAVAAASLGSVGVTVLVLARTWRDRPKSAGAWQRLKPWRRSQQTRAPQRNALRRRLLGINPLFWLASRQPVSAPVMMVLAVILTLATVYLVAPYFGRKTGPSTGAPVLGYLISWAFAGLAIHALVLYYAAMSAAQQLAEDKQTGALELLLSTPTTEQTISRGLWLAYGRKMLFPALLAVLVHVFFVWVVLVMATVEPPGPIPSGATMSEIFWGGVLNQPVRGRMLDWEFGFMLRCLLLILLQLILAWPTLGWVGRWLGLRMKHAGFAPITSLALLIAPPISLFSLACYLADKLNLDRMPERRFLPLMMWLALTIGIGHCIVLSVWASNRLRHQLRAVALSRYQPLPGWRWRLPSPRTVSRFAIATAATAAALALLVFGYFTYQNGRSKRAWHAFQTSLKQSGESLSLSSLLPEPVPDDANLARLPAFLNLLGRATKDTTNLFEQIRQFAPSASAPQGNLLMMDWKTPGQSPLRPFLAWTRPNAGTIPNTKREADAAALLQDLESYRGALQEMEAAAARLAAFQTSTNRDAAAVLQHARREVILLEHLHLVFQMRACALLALGRNSEAAEDVLTGLRLAQLVRQLQDTRATVRVQVLLTRSLQPLWEGLSQHAWSEPQLASFQSELGRFNLLADYTNAVRRVVAAHIEMWGAIPDSTNSNLSLPAYAADYGDQPLWQLQPRAWWFDNCIQLHLAGRNVLELVDVAGGRIASGVNWSDLNGLPLESASLELLQQSVWWGANPSGVVFAQTSINQGAIACALERFRLAKRVYPGTLDKLVPELLDRVPRDAVSGRPMIYEPTEDESFILRGVGPNGTDDRKLKVSDDWLWAYSTNTPSAKK